MSRPHFSENVRVTLMERKDDPMAPLAVYRAGWPYCVPLPQGYDGRTSVRWHDGYVLVAHPELPSLQVQPTGVQLIDDGHILAQDGRMKLVTH